MKILIICFLVAFIQGIYSEKTTCCPVCPPPKILNITHYRTIQVPHHVYVPVFKTIKRVVEVCPPDFNKTEEHCVKVVKMTNTCPPGYYRISDDTCEQVLILKKTLIITIKPLICPKGYIRKGKYRCIKIINCPKGFTKTEDGDCVENKIVCPKGTFRIGRACIKHGKPKKNIVDLKNFYIKVNVLKKNIVQKILIQFVVLMV